MTQLQWKIYLNIVYLISNINKKQFKNIKLICSTISKTIDYIENRSILLKL